MFNTCLRLSLIHICKEGEQHQLHMPTLHGMLLNNVNILLNETPLKRSTEDPVALFKDCLLYTS